MSVTPPRPECCWCGEPATDLIRYARGPHGPRPIAVCPCCPTGHTATALGQPSWRRPIDSPGASDLLANAMSPDERLDLQHRVQGKTLVGRNTRIRVVARNAGLVTRNKELTTLAYRVAVALGLEIPSEEPA